MKDKSLIFVISKRETIIKTLENSKGISFDKKLIFMAEGTYNSAYLKMLDLDKTSKEIALISVNREDELKALDYFDKSLSLSDKNTGIAFAVPMKDFGVFSKDNLIDYKDYPYHLVNVIVESKKSEQVMDTCQNENIKGGTIIKARGGGVPKEFYFPLTVEEEKDIVLILVKNNEVDKLQKALVKNLRLNDPNSGIMFILPVSNAIGLSKIESEDK